MNNVVGRKIKFRELPSNKIVEGTIIMEYISSNQNGTSVTALLVQGIGEDKKLYNTVPSYIIEFID